MNKKIPILIVAIFGFSALTLASGPGTFDIFDDLISEDNEYEYVDNWYSEAAHFLKNADVIQGIDGNFVAEKVVSRAELAVILKRYHDYLTIPMGTKWEQVKNNYYSVSYPIEASYTNKKITMEECDSGLMGLGDNRFYVVCMDSEENNIQDILKGMEGDVISISYNTFVLNGSNAWKITRIFSSGDVSESIVVEGGDKIYQLGYGRSLNDVGFETFYRGFKPL